MALARSMAAKDAMRETGQSLGSADAGRLRPPIMPQEMRLQSTGQAFFDGYSQPDAGIQHMSPLPAGNHFGPATHGRIRQAPMAASAPSLLLPAPASVQGVFPQEVQAACAASGMPMPLPANVHPTQIAFSRQCGAGPRRPASAGPQRQTSPSRSRPVSAHMHRQASPSPPRPASAGLQRHAANANVSSPASTMVMRQTSPSPLRPTSSAVQRHSRNMNVSSSATALVDVKSATLTSPAAAALTPVGSYLKLIGLSQYAAYFVDLGLVSLESISGQTDEELLSTLERVPLFPGHKARLLRGAQVLREASLVGVRQQSSRAREEQTLIQLCQRNDELCQQYDELAGQADSLRQQNGELSAELLKERSRIAELECLVQTQAEQVGFLAEQLQRILVDGALPPVDANVSGGGASSSASGSHASEAAAVGMVYDSKQATAPAIFSVARPQVPLLPLSAFEPQAAAVLQTLPENDDESADEEESYENQEEQRFHQPQQRKQEAGAQDLGIGAEEPGASENRRIVDALRRKQNWQPEQKIVGEREQALQAQVLELNRRLAEAEAASTATKGAAAAAPTTTSAPSSARTDFGGGNDNDPGSLECIATGMALAIKKKLEEPGTAQARLPRAAVADEADVFISPGAVSRCPDHFEIAEFLLDLFRSIQLSGLAAVLALLYLDRFTQRSGTQLCPRNWHRLSVTVTLLASMLWDSRDVRLTLRDALDSAEFAEILPLYSEEEIQEFHRAFLRGVGGDLQLSREDFHRACQMLQESSAALAPAALLGSESSADFGVRLQERSLALQVGLLKAWTQDSASDIS